MKSACMLQACCLLTMKAYAQVLWSQQEIFLMILLAGSELIYKTHCMTHFKHFTAYRDTTINPFYAKSYLADISYFLCYYSSSSSSSSSSWRWHRVGPLVDPSWSHTPRSLFNSVPWFLLLVGLRFIIYHLFIICLLHV